MSEEAAPAVEAKSLTPVERAHANVAKMLRITQAAVADRFGVLARNIAATHESHVYEEEKMLASVDHRLLAALLAQGPAEAMTFLFPPKDEAETNS